MASMKKWCAVQHLITSPTSQKIICTYIKCSPISLPKKLPSLPPFFSHSAQVYSSPPRARTSSSWTERLPHPPCSSTRSCSSWCTVSSPKRWVSYSPRPTCSWPRHSSWPSVQVFFWPSPPVRVVWFDRVRPAYPLYWPTRSSSRWCLRFCVANFLSSTK